MKNFLAIITAMVGWMAGQYAGALTLNWGSEFASDLVDSNGNTLGLNDYTFALGTFGSFDGTNTFVPFTPIAIDDEGTPVDERNFADWAANWHPFDTAAYEVIEDPDSQRSFGYFTSTVEVPEDGGYANLGLNFQDLDAYLWIYNNTTPGEGTEWLLVRAESWVFPKSVNCCPGDLLEWSVSDLADITPIYGKQSDKAGAGAFTDAGSHTLQTYTFVPEPSLAMLLGLAGGGLVLRRRRNG